MHAEESWGLAIWEIKTDRDSVQGSLCKHSLKTK